MSATRRALFVIDVAASRSGFNPHIRLLHLVIFHRAAVNLSRGDKLEALVAEREHIGRALEHANWVIGGPSGAAKKLAMKRTTLQSKRITLGIRRPTSRLPLR